MRTLKRCVERRDAQTSTLSQLLEVAQRPSLGASKSAAAPEVATARSVASQASQPTERLQKVNGALVNVLSTARIDKKWGKLRRDGERLQRRQSDLQRREQAASSKLNNVALISGYCGTDTPFLYTPKGGTTYRKQAALDGCFGRDLHQQAAAVRVETEKQAKNLRATSGAALALGQPSCRFKAPRGSKPLVSEQIQPPRGLARLSNGSAYMPERTDHGQHKVRQKLSRTFTGSLAHENEITATQ